MASNTTFKQASDLQRELEQTLVKLERSGLLREASGDEIRTIVAEDIADGFGERYRSFPCGARQENLQIRRDSLPSTCVLKTRLEERARATGVQTVAQVKKARSSLKITNSERAEGASNTTSQNNALINNGDKSGGVNSTAPSSPRQSAAPTNVVTQDRIQAWVAGVGVGSSRSASPEKKSSVSGTSLLTADDSRMLAIFANPPKLSYARSSSAASTNKSGQRGGSSKASQASESSVRGRQLKQQPIAQAQALSTVAEVITPQTAGFPAEAKTERPKVVEDAVQLLAFSPVRKATPVQLGEDDLISFSP